MLDVRISVVVRRERMESDGEAAYILFFEDGFWLWRLLVDTLPGENFVGDVARLRNKS